MQKYNKILVLSTCCLMVTIVLGFIGFPVIVKLIVKDQTALKHRNLIRKFYLKLPVSLDFRVYFFNITNPLEVMDGKTPVLKEIGPYHYDAYKEKIETLDNEGEDSLTYTPYETYFFNQERSGELTADDDVTILHPLVAGSVNFILRDFPVMVNIVDRAIKELFGDPKSIYFTAKVKDILFDGLVINCSARSFTSTAVCTHLKGIVPGLAEVSKNIYKFSLLGPRNGTLPNRFKVLRGIKKSQELGRLVELNHQKEIKIWSTKQCNRFKGTDSWIFPPFVDKAVGLSIFSADLCRNVKASYVNDTKYRGIFAEKYYADLGDMSSNPAEKCYCPTPKTCLPKGVMDLTKCMGVPIYATLPHFLRTDESLQQKVKGLTPNIEDHIVRLVIEPMLAVPLSAQKRMQFNLPIQRVSKITLMKNVPELLHPIFWIEEGIELDGPLLKMIQLIFASLEVFAVVKYIFLGISLGGLGIGGWMHYKDRKSVMITPIRTATSSTVHSSRDIILMSKPNSTEKNEGNDDVSTKVDEFDKY